MTLPTRTLWGLTDGSAGMMSQVEGVLAAIGSPYIMKTVKRRRPFVWLPVACWRGALLQLEAGSDALGPPWPDAVVSSGRRSAGIALAIARASDGRTKTVHLTDPRGCRARFDLIVAMAHDKLADAPNVMRTQMALHRVTPQALAEQGAQWTPAFAHLPRPLTAVLIGGSTNKYALTEESTQALIARLDEAYSREQGGWLITVSRRTGEANTARLREAFAGRERVFWHEGQGANPYLGFLALAERFIVTDDSVNMLSEAACTGKPLHILNLPGHGGTKPANFARGLITQGIARELALPLQHWTYALPDETQRVAHAVRALL